MDNNKFVFKFNEILDIDTKQIQKLLVAQGNIKYKKMNLRFLDGGKIEMFDPLSQQYTRAGTYNIERNDDRSIALMLNSQPEQLTIPLYLHLMFSEYDKEHESDCIVIR